jgi:formylmethanofuran dehydrogenase subunit C
VDGGTLTTIKWVIVGINTGSNGTINMKSGTFTINSTLLLGDREEGTGHVNLDGGVLTVNNLEMRRGADTVGTMDVQAGTLIVNGNAVSTIQGYIDNGWITAYNGNGTLELEYDITNEGQTTLKAVHKLNPSPRDGGLVSSGDTEIS